MTVAFLSRAPCTNILTYLLTYLIQNNLIDVRCWMPEGHSAESNGMEHLRLLKPTMHRVHTTCGGESCHLFYRRVSSNFPAMTAVRRPAARAVSPAVMLVRRRPVVTTRRAVRPATPRLALVITSSNNNSGVARAAATPARRSTSKTRTPSGNGNVERRVDVSHARRAPGDHSAQKIRNVSTPAAANARR